MAENRPFEYTRKGTFFPYMTPASLARMDPGRREIQERVEARYREIERTTPRWELERQMEEEERALKARVARERQGSMPRHARFAAEWSKLARQAKAESWPADRAKKRFARLVARHLGQDGARGRGRVLDVFERHGGSATRLGVVELLREGVSVDQGFKWLDARAGNQSPEVVPSSGQGALV